MEYRNLKWMTVVLPVLLISLFELVRHFYLDQYWSLLGTSLLALVVLGVGAYVFAEWVFRTISEMHGRLLREEERYRALFINTSDAVVILDSNGRISQVNPAVEKVTGWRSTELVGRTCTALVECAACADPRPERCRLLAAVHAGEPVPCSEMQLKTRAGSRVPVSASHAVIRQGGDGAAQVAVVMRDLSDHKRLEQEIAALYRESQRRLQQVEALYQIGQEVASLVDLDHNIESVVEKTRRLLQADLAGWCEVVPGRLDREVCWGQRE